MSRDEFASLYLKPNQKLGTGRLVDYTPLASPQIERARLCHLTGLSGHLEASVSHKHSLFARDARPADRWVLQALLLVMSCLWCIV